MTSKPLKQTPQLTRISSKGQVVIPKDIRQQIHVKAGDVFAMTRANADMIILKRIKDPILQQDLYLLKEIEKAWKEIEGGHAQTMSQDAFLKAIRTW